MRKILFVNWNLSNIEDISDILNNENFKISFTYGIEQTKKILSFEEFDVIVLKKNSSITKKELRNINPNVHFIISNSLKDSNRTLIIENKNSLC